MINAEPKKHQSGPNCKSSGEKKSSVFRDDGIHTGFLTGTIAYTKIQSGEVVTFSVWNFFKLLVHPGLDGRKVIVEQPFKDVIIIELKGRRVLKFIYVWVEDAQSIAAKLSVFAEANPPPPIF